MPSAYFTLFYLIAIQIHQWRGGGRPRKHPGVTHSLKCQLLFMVVAYYCRDSQKSHYSVMTSHFFKSFCSLSCHFSTKVKIPNWFQNCYISGEGSPLGYLVFDELKMTSFLLALVLIITVCWEHTAVNGGRGNELKPRALATSSSADISETNRPDCKIDLFSQSRQFSTEDSGAVILFPHKTAPVSKQCIFQGSTSVSLVAHSSKVSPMVPSEMD